MNHLPAKYDFFPGCLAMVIRAREHSKNLGSIVTCIKTITHFPDGDPVNRVIWEVDQVFEWEDEVKGQTFPWSLAPQDCLMPLPPPDGIILSEEELLLLCH